MKKTYLRRSVVLLTGEQLAVQEKSADSRGFLCYLNARIEVVRLLKTVKLDKKCADVIFYGECKDSANKGLRADFCVGS